MDKAPNGGGVSPGTRLKRSLKNLRYLESKNLAAGVR